MSWTEKELKQKNNIVKEIDMKTYIIHGKMRQWKTVTAIHMSLDARFNWRIYSNVWIYYNWISILTKKITDFDQLNNIRFSYEHWIIIIDEAWINANSKDGFSDSNRLLQRILFLAGKKNCSVLWIAQRFESIDVNARVLADYIVKVNKIRRSGGRHPIFILTKQKQKRTVLEYVQQYRLDVIHELNELGITYDTLEESVMKNDISRKRNEKLKKDDQKIKAKKRSEKKKKIAEKKKLTRERKKLEKINEW